MRLRRFLIATLVLATFMTAGGGLSQGSFFAETASAAGCQSPSIGFGRWRWCGYWYNKFQDEGESVRIGGVPGSVNSAGNFINLLKSDLASGNQNKITAAKFVIRTMIGAPLPSPQPVGSAKSLTAAQIADWESRVRTYANLGENGTTSYGTNGRIDWFASLHRPCGGVNTYWQPTYNDIAPFTDTPANSDCDIASSRDIFMVFRDKSGAEVYKIRRACMNPMGNIDPLTSNPAPSFNLSPSINAAITNSSGPVTGNVAQPGETVTFRYLVNNSGSDPSVGTICTIYGNTRNGYVPTPSPATASSGGAPYTPPPLNCPPTMPRGSRTVATEVRVITTADVNKTICRSLFVNPATLGGPARGSETCILVASKPYLRVFGGDVSAGGGYETAPNTCATNANAGIIAWNNRGGAAYAGAGVQYAAQALSAITDFATAQNAGSSAAPPRSLAQASSPANVGIGRFGGAFGTAACIKDYYGSLASANATTVTVGSVGADALPDGSSSKTSGGLTTITAGTITAGKQSRLYVNGDVYIDGNITLPASYDYKNIPTFELIVRGNIYVDNDVTELNGMFVAQPNGASGGTIYTCATGAAALPLNGALYNTCRKKLLVNGSFIAKSVEFLRTGGSVYQSTAAESGSSPAIAEVFNYTPALWVRQPGKFDKDTTYDAITSLPPIL